MRIIIECPERILHLEAGYIYADRLFASSTLLQSGGGPYIFANPYIGRVQIDAHRDEGLCRESLTGLSLLGKNPLVVPASPKSTPHSFGTPHS